MQGVLKKPQAADEVISSVEKLAEFIKLELVEGTLQSTLTRTLVKNGWDKKEATLFVRQIAKELETDPSYVRSQLHWLELGIAIVLLATAFWVPVRYATGGKNSAVVSVICWGALLILGLAVWLVYRIRLTHLGTKTNKKASQAILFSPTKGNLQITKLYTSWIQWISDLVWYTSLGLRIILLLLCLAVLAFVVLDSFVFG
jgi:hypothetical protein